jgi:FAD-dependent urate hydroxylase
MSEKRTALIIGAGIGGLAAGLALRRAGWHIRVHERAASPRELGFGLGLAPNALSALHELGVAEPVVRAGAQLAKVEFRYTNGRVLRRLNLQFGFPAVVALRPDLHGALLTAVGDEHSRLAREAVSVSEDAGGITVHFNDGSTDTGTMLVGADGVHSTIRKCLHPHERPPRPSGFCAIRGVAYGVSHHLGDLSGVGYLDNAIEAATVRASSDAVYWYMSLRVQDVVDATPQAILNQRYRGFESPLRSILSATKPDDMRFDQLFERDALRCPSRVGPQARHLARRRGAPAPASYGTRRRSGSGRCGGSRTGCCGVGRCRAGATAVRSDPIPSHGHLHQNGAAHRTHHHDAKHRD